MPPLSDTDLFSLLDQHGVSHETHEHPAIFTVDEGKEIKTKLLGGHTKNLFLKDKSGQYVLVCAISDTEIKLNHLHKVIGTKRLSFGKAEDLYDLLGVRPGSVTLFSIINDPDGAVRLVLDKALFNHERVWFHPLRNTASTAIYSADITTFAEHANHKPLIVDLRTL